MKRKEMVNLLGQFLHTQSFGQGNWPTADNILKFLEENGMFPPAIRILEDHYDRANGEMGYMVHEWEEERSNGK